MLIHYSFRIHGEAEDRARKKRRTQKRTTANTAELYKLWGNKNVLELSDELNSRETICYGQRLAPQKTFLYRLSARPN